MTSLETMVKYYLRRDLSGDEIKKLIGREPVLYSDLKNYKSVDDLLGRYNYVVVLYQKAEFDGHYVSLFKDDDGNLNYQDSYGYGVDVPINMGLLPFDKPLPRYLGMLIEKSGRRLITNTFDYQRGKMKGYADCGRHACLRIRCRKMSNDDYRYMMTNNVSKFLTPDHNAVMLTLLALDDLGKLDNE
jgi:hypothetical protein